jgi:hypothetical protein
MKAYNLKEMTTMFKKIIVGALLIGVIGVLIAGAVTRTNAKNGEGAGETGRRGLATEFVATAGDVQGNGGRWAQNEATEQARGGQGNGGRWAQNGAAEQAQGGQDSGTLNGVSQADVQPAEWRTIQGIVVSAADDLVEIKSTTGEVIPFEGQPLRYALEQGFSLEAGDAVALGGFDEDGEFKIGKVESLGNGMSITLRDASGRPGWAGRGQGGQRGQRG